MEDKMERLAAEIQQAENLAEKIRLLSKLKKLKKLKASPRQKRGGARVKIGRGVERTRSNGKQEIIPLAEARLLQQWREVKVMLDFSRACGFYDQQKKLVIENVKEGQLLVDIYEQRKKGFPDTIIRLYLQEQYNPKD